MKTLTRFLRANGSCMRVVLQAAAADEECPLSLTTMCTDQLDFAPGLTFSRAFPDLRKMTLPCGHSFGAMTLLYHFACNHMRCPMCRHGTDNRLLVASIPTHCRRIFSARIKAVDREARAQQELDDLLIAREALASVAQDLEFYTDNTFMDVFSIVDGMEIHVLQFKMLLLCRIMSSSELGIYHFSLSSSQRRSLFSHMNDLGFVNIFVKFHVQNQNISISPTFPIRHTGDHHLPLQCTYGQMTVAYSSNEQGRFRSLVWSISGEDLARAM